MDFPRQFIRRCAEFSTLYRYIPAPLLRRSFTPAGQVASARLLVGSPGYYEVHVNGRDVTKGQMAPYRANPDHLVYFDCYDVTDALISGKNVLGLILGNGFQNPLGGFIWKFDQAPWRGAPSVAFRLELTYADGSSEVVESDTGARTADSAILFDDVHYGEYYDARREIPGWDTPDFDDSGWDPAEIAPAPRGQARLCEAEPIRFQEEISPVEIFPCDGGYVYDFGLNGAGLCRLTVNGAPGQKLVLKFFEQLLDGKPTYRHIRFNNGWNYTMRYQEDEYTCAGGPAVHVPRFTYHGFRYVFVEGITAEQAKPELLTYLVLHSDLKQIGHFACSDPMINAIQAATVRSDRTCFHYFPTDCPQREKNGWTGDASLSAEQIMMNFDASVSYREWMRSIYKAYDDEGNLPGIVPTAVWGYGTGPAWDAATTNLAYSAYALRGEKQLLEEFAVPLMRQLTFLYGRLDDRDLLSFGLGDWCPPNRGADGFTTPNTLTSTVYGLDIARKAAFIYDVLDMPEKKAYAEALAKRLEAAARKTFIDPEKRVSIPATQTGQALMLAFGLFTQEEIPDAVEQLLALLREFDDHMDTGVLGARYLFRVLADYGHAELAYHVIARPDHPSYGSWIARGATTLWEYFKDPSLPYGSSMNHHFWGDVSAWFYIYLAGLRINPTGKDVTHVDIAPEFVKQLTWAEAEYQLPAGKIRVRWERTAEGVTLHVTASENLHGTIRLPRGWKFADGTAETALRSGMFHGKQCGM